MEEKQSNGLAIASMVLGIVSLILTCILPYVSWVLAIVGIVLAAIAKKKAKAVCRCCFFLFCIDRRRKNDE